MIPHQSRYQPSKSVRIFTSQTEQASKLIELYLGDLHDRPEIPDGYHPSMEERRAVVEQVISKPPGKKHSAPAIPIDAIPSSAPPSGVRQQVLLPEYATRIEIGDAREEQRRNQAPSIPPLQPVSEEVNHIPQQPPTTNGRHVGNYPAAEPNGKPKGWRAPPPPSSNILARGHNRKGGKW